MAAFTFLAEKRRSFESHRELSLLSLANSGEGKEIQKQLDTWEKDL
jgi:hypothetical protein